MVHGAVLAFVLEGGGVMWAVTQTPSQGKAVKTKKHAQRLLTLWKRHKQAKGMTVVGSVGAGLMIASPDGLISTEAFSLDHMFGF